MKKLISTLALVPLSLAGVAVSSYTAQAATIGPGGIPCNNCLQFANIQGTSSVNVKTTPTGGPATQTTFTFAPPAPNANFNVTGSSPGPFAGFIAPNGNGTANDLTIPFAGGTPISGATPFLVFNSPPGTPTTNVYNLEVVGLPTFTELFVGSTLVSTTFSFATTGEFVSSDGNKYDGIVTLGATFSGLSALQVLDQADNAEGISTSWSATGSIAFTPPLEVPEPSLVGGLAVVFGSALLLRKKNKLQ